MLFSSQKTHRHCLSPSVLTAAWQELGRRHILARVPTACGWTRCDAQAMSWRWSSVGKVLGGNTTASTPRMQECRAAHFQVVLEAPAFNEDNKLRPGDKIFLSLLCNSDGTCPVFPATRRFCEIGGRRREPRGTARSFLPRPVGHGVRRWLDQLEHSGGVPTAWFQVLWWRMDSLRHYAPVPVWQATKRCRVSASLPFRSGETVLSEDTGWAPGSTMGSGPIHLDEVSCTGKEPGLLLCNKREWLQHDCTHWEDVHIACNPERSGKTLPSSELNSHSNVLRMETGMKWSGNCH